MRLRAPPRGFAPSATTTMLKCRPIASRARILSHNFDMRGAKPVEVRHVTVEPGGDGDFFVDEDGNHTVYKWLVPWEPEQTAP